MKLNRNKMAMLMIAIMVTSVVMPMASAQVTVLDDPPPRPMTVEGNVTYANGSRVPDGWLVTLTDVTDGIELGNDTTADKYPTIPLYKVEPIALDLIIEGHVIETSVSNDGWSGNMTHTVESGDIVEGGTITMADIVVQKGGEPVLTTIEVTPSTKTLNVNDTQEFNATAKDQDGNVMPDVVITWTSSNETVGTIDAGLFTAKVNGTTTVTAANETVNGTANVTVQSGVQPVLTTIEVSPSTATLNVNATKKFNATAKDQDGNVMSDVVINWTSSNETVGTVTADAGLFTALAVGTTTVTAANGTVNGTANVTVQEVVPQNLTVTNLEADPNTGVNTANPTTVSATITSSAALELIALYAIDTKNYQSKQYALYVEDIPVAGDDYSADWDATEFKVQNETTSSGTKPVFVGKTDRWDTTTYYAVLGNLTINETSVTAAALFNTGDLKLSEIVDPDTKERYSVEPGNTTFAPFALDATNRGSIINPLVLLGNLEPLDAVTLTGTAPDYNISLVKTQVPNEDYVVGMAARDEAEDKEINETTVSVSTTEDYAVSISTDDAGITVAPNVKATYTLTVQNDGTKTDNYTLSLTREDADHAELGRVNITNLSVGETQNVSLNVSDAREGTYTVNVTVESQTDTNVTDMVSTLTTVKTKPAPTPTPRIRRGGGGGGGGVSDSDGDGYSDIEEIIVGTDPYDPCDPNPACVACIGEAIIAKVITTPEPTPYDPAKGITPPTTKPVTTIPPLEEPTPTPTPPGFEAVFAIAGLLAVAYLVQRRRK